MRNPQVDPVILAAIDTYVIALGALCTAHHALMYPNLVAPRISVEIRQKYAKIIKDNSSYSYVNLVAQRLPPTKSRGVFDLEPGDVVKGNWKGPERAVLHIRRGNVLDGSWLEWHCPHGIGYADGHGRGEFRAMLSDDDYMVALDAIKGNENARAADHLARACSEGIARLRAARKAS